MKDEIEVVKKENGYLRNRNFVINKGYQNDLQKIKKAKILNRESEQVRNELEKEVQKIEQFIENAQKVLGRNSLLHVIGEKEQIQLSPGERNRKIKVKSQLRDSKVNFAQGTNLASDATNSLIKAIAQDSGASQFKPVEIVSFDHRKKHRQVKLQLTESKNVMDLDVAFKIRENQQEIDQLTKRQKIESEKRKTSTAEDGDEERDGTQEMLRKLELSQLKKSQITEPTIQSQSEAFPKSMNNNTSDIFHSRGLKMSRISGYKGETEKTATKENIRLAQDIKNLSKFNPTDIENQNGARTSLREAE